MKAVTHFTNYLLFIAAINLIVAIPAYAYLDPGAGSAILQGVIAAIAAIAVAVKIYWHRILVLLGIRKKIDLSDKTAGLTPTESVESKKK